MKERMNIVIAGHVDHGKSTLVGRLLVDTNSLPEGKLESVKRTCKMNSKPFEYAFLLDALVNEQAQGITIETARIFFNTDKREYIIIDAPGHIQFLKNMISGAARAEAAILLIDANEGIAENSKRHAYMLSLLDIRQVVVAVNKMDLVKYSKEVFENITINYTQFLNEINIQPLTFIPISAMDGENIVRRSSLTPWYHGKTVIELIDSFKNEMEDELKPFRMFVQGVYKFTSNGDSRRIIAGSISSGNISTGDEIIFLPSGCKTKIKSIEQFNNPEKSSAGSGEAIGFTLEKQVYVKPSELMCKSDEKLPYVSDSFRANIVWLGKKPLMLNKTYKIKIGTQKTNVVIKYIENVLNASSLENYNHRDLVEKHEVAQCILTTSNKVSFDLIDEDKSTGRFVIIDDYDIAGGGIIVSNIENNNPYNITPNIPLFEMELNALIRKHFPHWQSKKIFPEKFIEEVIIKR